jgi:dipeptidyl aminopeptidase/acylaminoacyl peptidase
MTRLALLIALLVTLVAAAPAAATFPGRNGPIAYYGTSSEATEDGGDAHTTLYVKRAASAGEKHALVDCFAPGGDFAVASCAVKAFHSPTYSPDGSRIAFDAGTQLAVVDADGANLRLLPAATTDDGDPAFTPNGRRIVFSGLDAQGAHGVYVRSVEGGPARLLVRNAAEPVLSSRNRLAFVRDRVVFVAAADGTHAYRVAVGGSPDWAPGGGRLVFVRPRGRQFLPNLTLGALFLVRADGSGLTRFSNVKDATLPVWSPNGRWIAYNKLEIGIAVRKVARGAKPHTIARTEVGDSGSTSAQDPGWRPLAR